MSKAYGICGLRIGYMLTANTAFAEKVRAGIHIWNLNGFAETFLKMALNTERNSSQAALKYEKTGISFIRTSVQLKACMFINPMPIIFSAVS